MKMLQSLFHAPTSELGTRVVQRIFIGKIELNDTPLAQVNQASACGSGQAKDQTAVDEPRRLDRTNRSGPDGPAGEWGKKGTDAGINFFEMFPPDGPSETALESNRPENWDAWDPGQGHRPDRRTPAM